MPQSWNPNEQDIFAGLSDLALPINTFDLGNGIWISKTYVHVFGPYLAAFKEPELGKPHPPPWQSVGSGNSFDIRAELYVPKSTNLFEEIDRLNTVWLIAALMRIKAIPSLRVPVISNIRFSEIANSDRESNFIPIELEKRELLSSTIQLSPIDLDNLEWVKNILPTAGKLFERIRKFAFALLCLDRSISETRYSLAILTLWGALEQLFSPDDKQEISYRTSLNIASYLKPRGRERSEFLKKVKKLYSARSKAAHGNPTEDRQEFYDTYALLKEAALKIIETNHVPTQVDFDALILE